MENKKLHKVKNMWLRLCGLLLLIGALFSLYPLVYGFDSATLWLGIFLVVFALPLIFIDFIQNEVHCFLETKIGKKISFPFRFISGHVSILYAGGRHNSIVVRIFYGLFSGLLSALIFYIAFFEGINSKDFYSLLVPAFIVGIVSFLFLSPWRKLNFLLGGSTVIIFGFYVINSDIFWGVSIILVGTALVLRFFSMTFFNNALFPILRSRTFKTMLKIMFWGSLVVLGFLIFAGIISLIAGLSATSIIIILLVLILLK